MVRVRPDHPRWLLRPVATRVAAVAAVAIVAPGCGSGATGPDCAGTPLARRVTAAQAGGLPGVAAAVLTSATGPEVAVAGVRRLGAPAAVAAGDHFHAASLTKAMTATMLATLVEEGRLAWDAGVLDVLPELAAAADPAYRAVTLEQLLTHRAGIPPYLDLADIERLPAFAGDVRAQRLAFADYVLRRPPASTPGGAPVYANADYVIAAAMAERVAGAPWEALMQQRVFAPLGLRAGYGWPAADDAGQPWGHLVEAGRTTPVDPRGPYQLSPVFYPALGVHLSLGDYAAFARLHLRGLRGEAGLVSAATVRRLHAPVGAFAMGWGVQTLDGVATETHLGGSGTFAMAVALQPARDRAVVVATNADGPGVVDRVTGLVLGTLAGAPALAARGCPGG